MFSKWCSSFSYSEFKCFQNDVHLLVIQSSSITLILILLLASDFEALIVQIP